LVFYKKTKTQIFVMENATPPPPKKKKKRKERLSKLSYSSNLITYFTKLINQESR
jgi:hypothetical protein